MRNIIRWEPFREIMSLRQAMDKLLEDSFVTPSRLIGTFGLNVATPIDIYQTANEVVAKAALPGVKPEEVDITVTGDTLNIRGETKAEEKVEREDYLCQERRYGAFSRSVVIPVQVNTDKAEATFEDGVLTLTIPKAEAVKPKQIKVKADPKATKGKK